MARRVPSDEFPSDLIKSVIPITGTTIPITGTTISIVSATAPASTPAIDQQKTDAPENGVAHFASRSLHTRFKPRRPELVGQPDPKRIKIASKSASVVAPTASARSVERPPTPCDVDSQSPSRITTATTIPMRMPTMNVAATVFAVFQIKAIVLDINGVLADVRKIHSPRIPDGFYERSEIFRMPNNQIVYFRPGVAEFVSDVFDLVRANRETVALGVWTSRLRKNTTPILDAIRALVESRPASRDRDRLGGRLCGRSEATPFDFVLTGEDCTDETPLQCRNSPEIKPVLIKDASSLRLKCSGRLDPTARLLFVDDNAQRIRTDEICDAASVASFDALREIRDSSWEVYAGRSGTDVSIVSDAVACRSRTHLKTLFSKIKSWVYT